MLSGSVAWAADYLIKSGNYYIGMNAAGNALQAYTTPDASCVWTCMNGTTETTLSTTSRSMRNKKNTGYYLTATVTRSGGVFNRKYTWTIGAGTTATTWWRGNNNNFYVTDGSYNRNASISVANNGTISLTDNTQNNSQYYVGTAKSSEATYAGGLTAVNVSNSTLTYNANTGSTLTASQRTKEVSPACTEFTVGSDHFYWYNNALTSTLPSGSSTNVNLTSYTWSISGADYLSLASTTGATNTITYNQPCPNDGVTATISVTANYAEGGSVTKTTTVNLTKYTADPTAINASNMELTVGATQSVNPKLTCAIQDYSNIYTNLSYASNNTTVASVNATTGVVTANAKGTATITITARLQGGGSITKDITVSVAERAAAPTITFNSTTGELTMSSTTPGAEIHYTLTGIDPTVVSATYDPARKPTLTAGATVKAITIADGYVASNVTTLVVEQVTTPTVTVNGTNVNLACGTAGVTYYYTTDGSDPTMSSTSTTSTSLTTIPSGSTIKVMAVKNGMVTSEVASKYIELSLATPTITISGTSVTMTSPDGADIHYTTDGSEPTASSPTYTTPLTATNGVTYKAIAIKAGFANSEVAEEKYMIASGVSGGTVTINDYEDHTWTYYAGVDPEVDGGHYNTTYRAQGTTRPKYDAKIYSPNPRNVKITYNATNNAAVSLAESENSFVYYKTLEQGTTEGQYPYQVISNPFSKRPAHSGTTYYGFAGWKIVSGGQYINGYNDGQTLPLDAEITFVNLPYPSVNCTSAEIVFETTWTTANRTYISTNPGSNQTYTFNSGTYETNFVVINVNYTRQITISGSATIMMVEPDGSADYRTRAYSGALVPATGANNTTKIEFANWTATGTRDAYGRNLTIGRGMTMSTARNVVGSAQTGACNQVLKIESGNYGTFYHFTATPSSLTKQWITFGNDYDRAKKDWEGNNNTLNFSGEMRGAASRNVGKGSTDEMWRVVAKSGKYLTGVGGPQDAAAEQSYYIGVSGTHNNGHRYLEIQGGHWAGNISGGMGEDHTTTEPAFTFRMRGGHIVGSIYGAAQFAGAGGGRTYIITGGEINGWVAAGANGTQSSGGLNAGASYVYVGGNAVVDSKHSTTLINRSVGGNVYGAGCGYSGTSSSGEMTLGSNMVVADNAYIERGIYGGGAYGFVTNTQTSYIYITGGHVGGYTGQDYGSTTIQGGVYGGARQNKGGSAIIYMTGGLVETGIYGGSNNSGTMNGSVTMQINGGQVGTSTTPGNIHGGGYGQNTVINQNVDITIGKTDAARDADGVTVWGDVYGGSALGSVNGTAASNTKHTNVTMNAGYIHGSLYGGALGSSTVAANVYGPVQVKVYGGSVMKTDANGANGSGAVYGANNINGAPQRSVTVDIYGTNAAPAEGEYALFAVYGGGNQANYTYGNGYPKVTVHGCENSIEYVYGGGNAAAVAATDVTIYGGDKIGNVFGGGNGQVKAANVTGGTNVKIYGGTIGDVYGGSNTNGTIGGTINVNVNAQAESGYDACPVYIDNVYGGGNKAPSAAGNITIGCAEQIGAVYGGANQANITGNIDLHINAGHIDNVFGGNNVTGNISGTITVTVEDNGSDCGMLIGNVYGGGNQAAYGTGANYPVVRINHGHLTGSVFGGGLGETAVITGNPQVTIGDSGGAHTVSIDGNVFGGGDAADVVGKPVVLVQNCNTMIGTKTDDVWNATGGTVYGGGNAAHVTGAGNGTNVTINGGDINRVFGGGNGEVSPANVEGNAQTVIHAGNIHQAFAGSNMQGSIGGTATITVDHDGTCDEMIDEVYGGGNQAAGNAGAVNIDCGAIVGDVYGGANQADINSDITLNITGGTINRVFGGNNTSGNISGVITVNINKADACDLDLNYVYGAGNQASYTPSAPGAYPAVNILKGTVNHDVFGGGLGATAVVTSNPTVKVNGGTVSGNVFGGGSEANTVGTTSVIIQTGTVSTDVYGGGALADVEGNTTISITGGTVTGNIYGGGLGQVNGLNGATSNVAAIVTGNTTVNVNGGTTNNVFGCNNFNGGPQGTVNVTISGGTVINDVYGGGNLAAASANPIVTINGGTMQDVYGGGLGEPAVITGNTTININKTAATMTVSNVFGGGSAANVAGNTAITMTAGTVGNIYGGGEAANVIVGAAETGKTVVNMNGGTVSHSIYGGGLGNTTQVATSTTVTANGGTVSEDVYGGSGFGKVGATTVTINNGATVTRDVFGGGFGQKAEGGNPAYEADVLGNASVTINKGAVINGNVYGGNNTNGSPKGTITVLVDGPANATEKTATPLNLNDVFGGGKNAATTSTGAPAVTIRGCETVIARVFGGGDAAPAPATNVEIWGGHITSAFAGGNGEVTAADIVGDVTITIKGGAITNVFGGSNTAGNIGGAVNVIVDKDPAACDLDVTNLFGGGNLAPGKGGTLTIACTGDGKIDNVYGGANQADVEGDVTLVINGGNIGNAFGGNNASGTINGAIHVVIDWDGDCGVNNLDNVYGGGNLAPYTTPDGMVGPTVQLINATINNNVYGGGYGAPAKVTGNPIVTLEGATVTGNIFGGGDAAPVQGNPTVTAMYGSAAKIFAGGKGATAVVTGNPTAVLNKTDDQTLTVTEIYGGGDAAEVTGNTNVTLTKGAVTNAFGGGNAAAINGNTLVTIANATASNVYGGGNLAGVTETATINMTGGNVTTGLYGGCNSEGTVTGNIAVNVTGGQVGTDAEHKANVHGGGYGSATQTAGNVAVAVNGAGVVVYGDIYGGSALGNVNDDTADNTVVTIAAGTINGNVYGGGLGDPSNAALVNGNVAVNIEGGTITGYVFGCNNVNGTPKGAVTVTVTDGANANLTEVYGGGNMATYSPATAQAPRVIIEGCDNTIGYVYGGGNAADVPATDVTVWGGTIGNVFGGGHGNKDAVPAVAANVTGNVTVNIKGGTIDQVFAGSNSKGTINGTATLTVNKEGTCLMKINDVYGGGNQAAGNAGTVNIVNTGNSNNGEGIKDVYGGARQADVTSGITLNITGGNIDRVFGGNNISGAITGAIVVNINEDVANGGMNLNTVYGAGNQADYTGNPVVNIIKGTVQQDVFGGGLQATVTGNTTVNVSGGQVVRDLYGGGALANVVGNTAVNLTGGTVCNAYGGGLGSISGQDGAEETVAALVTGNTLVTLNGSIVTGQIFGANNVNGTPQGHAKVWVMQTVAQPGQGASDFHVAAVYGGGNKAGYYPTNDNELAEVVIEGCDSRIEYVYGGGNAAPSPATQVYIKGGTFKQIFGGGNGKGDGNPGADIGYKEDHTTSYGSGKTNVYFWSGEAESLFGGSNTKGNIRVESAVHLDDKRTETGCDKYSVGDVFGAGNEAFMEGSSSIDIECVPYMQEIYGGANNADMGGDVVLTITSGSFGKVFGGNNKGGSIMGSITVNVEETGCYPVEIEELYGCGNNAAYSVYGYNDDKSCKETGDRLYADPVVNVYSCTKIGTVFGGGYGPSAVVIGNPTVNINQVPGEWAVLIDADGDGDADNDESALGTIGTVFGGGNAALVKGNTNVNIGTLNKYTVLTGVEAGHDKDILGVNITGNVYGGGNAADVTGNTNVVVGTGE